MNSYLTIGCLVAAFCAANCLSIENESANCGTCSGEDSLILKIIELERKLDAIEQNTHFDEMKALIKRLNGTYLKEIVDKIDGMDRDIKRLNDINSNLQQLVANCSKTTTTDDAVTDSIAFRATNLSGASSKRNYIFTNATLNDGHGNNTSTGLFTAPVDGLYLFDVHMSTWVNSQVNYAVVKDGERIGASKQNDESADSCNSMSVLARLSKGNEIWVAPTYRSGRYWDDDTRRCSFQGVLLYK